jgi:hypothetical protein
VRVGFLTNSGLRLGAEHRDARLFRANADQVQSPACEVPKLEFRLDDFPSTSEAMKDRRWTTPRPTDATLRNVSVWRRLRQKRAAANLLRSPTRGSRWPRKPRDRSLRTVHGDVSLASRAYPVFNRGRWLSPTRAGPLGLTGSEGDPRWLFAASVGGVAGGGSCARRVLQGLRRAELSFFNLWRLWTRHVVGAEQGDCPKKHRAELTTYRRSPRGISDLNKINNGEKTGRTTSWKPGPSLSRPSGLTSDTLRQHFDIEKEFGCRRDVPSTH